ncbi:hypothetical protein [Ekhidna sp.]
MKLAAGRITIQTETMKPNKLFIPFAAIIFLGSAVFASNLLKTPSEVIPIIKEDIKVVDLSSDEAFHKMMDVLTHQRCVNCHPNDNIPKQGEDRHPHRFGITRSNSAGMAATNCNTCHQDSNNNNSGVPGAPEWSLAPPEMQWEGLDRYEIAASMKDRSKNGNRSLEDLMHHLTEHELVLWAWEPGVDAEGNPRELPPVSKEEYIAAVKEWIEAGAKIPAKN